MQPIIFKVLSLNVLNSLCLIKQESTPAAEEEAVPGPAPGQNREPDQQPGANGE